MNNKLSSIKKILILIPARFASSRFPGKPLHIIAGTSLIQRVYQKTQEIINANNYIFESWVVTDSQEIKAHVESFDGNVCMVADEVQSGSERIYLAWERFFKNKGYDLIVNLQGDEPLLGMEDLGQLVDFHFQSDCDIVTLVQESKNERDFRDPNRVKAIFLENTGQCLYFSRSPIPYFRKEESRDAHKWYLHIGVYSYRPNALVKFFQSPVSFYEEREKLEQLRALEFGQKIGAIKTNNKLIGVDTPEDAKMLEEILSGKSN